MLCSRAKGSDAAEAVYLGLPQRISFCLLARFICKLSFVCLFSVISPIDGKSMESIPSVKIFHGSEFRANGKVIRWTEVQSAHFTERQ